MRPRITRAVEFNPALIDPVTNTYAPEIYSIEGHPDVIFLKRMDAIAKTKEVAKAKKKDIIITLNSIPFCRVQKDGYYDYIYNPSEDKITAPSIKQFLINRGCVAN